MQKNSTKENKGVINGPGDPQKEFIDGPKGPIDVTTLDPDRGQETFQVPFTIQEIDRIMSAMLELNVPIRTWLLLDQKFGPIRHQASVKRGIIHPAHGSRKTH